MAFRAALPIPLQPGMDQPEVLCVVIGVSDILVFDESVIDVGLSVVIVPSLSRVGIEPGVGYAISG